MTKKPANSPTTGTEPCASEPEIHLVDGVAVVHGLSVTDTVALDLLQGVEPDARAELLTRMIAVGARGMSSMGIDVDLHQVDARVKATMTAAGAETEARIRAMFEELSSIVAADLDPDSRTSRIGRFLDGLDGVQREMSASIDPQRNDSGPGRLLSRLEQMFGENGEVERRLAANLDLGSSESPLARLEASMVAQLAELRSSIDVDRGRRLEAERGTAKGFDFEESLEFHLRRWAATCGAIVERTADVAGSAAGEALVGDFVISTSDGVRIVVEAKNRASVGLTGAAGILAELDGAMANREADVAVCVSARDSFPSEVGAFNVYGNRVLVVDDCASDATMLAVAMRWAIHAATLAARQDEGADVESARQTLQRLRQLATLFSNHRRALTDISKSINQANETAGDIRTQLLELVDEADRHLARHATGSVIHLAERDVS